MFTFQDEFDLIIGRELILQIIEKRQGDGVTLPFYYWEIRAEGKTVGKISLRIGRNFHTYYDGNIGYEIDQAYRGSHYSRKACKMILPVARAHGMEELLLTCKESNIASYRTIEGLGGKLLEIAEVPKEYFAWREGMERQRVYSLAL